MSRRVNKPIIGKDLLRTETLVVEGASQNVAVGGNWPGSPDSNTIFPQVIMIDFVRVYQRSD